MDLDNTVDKLMTLWGVAGGHAMQRYRNEPITKWYPWLSVHLPTNVGADGTESQQSFASEAEALLALRDFIKKTLEAT